MRSGTDLLTIKEVADLLRVSRASVSRWAGPNGPLQPIRVGGIVRFRRDDVERLLVPEGSGPLPEAAGQ